MLVRTGPPRRIASPVRSPVTIVPSSLSSHQSPRKAAHRRQALVAIAEAHERAGADEAGDLAVELLVPQRDLGRRPPDQQPHRVYRSGQDCSPPHGGARCSRRRCACASGRERQPTAVISGCRAKARGVVAWRRMWRRKPNRLRDGSRGSGARDGAGTISLGSPCDTARASLPPGPGWGRGPSRRGSLTGRSGIARQLRGVSGIEPLNDLGARAARRQGSSQPAWSAGDRRPARARCR